MTPEDVAQMRQVAYVMATTVAATAWIEAMKAANAEREARGHAQAYNEEAFERVAQDFGLHHNAVVAALKP